MASSSPTAAFVRASGSRQVTPNPRRPSTGPSTGENTDDLDATVEGTQNTCSLSTGDLIRLAEVPAEGAPVASILVVTSKRGNCAAGARLGGEALPSTANVQHLSAVEAMVAAALGQWGRVDMLVNNAGILRDRTFAKQELEDFRLVLDVHVMGAVHCTKAVWPHLHYRGYGLINVPSSSYGV